MVDARAVIGHSAAVHAIGTLLMVVSVVGALCLLIAAWRAKGLDTTRLSPTAARGEAVSILKPLYGAEPQLFENLATFLDQDHRGAIQIVCGVQDAGDAAVGAVERLRVAYPHADIALVVDRRSHGRNAKIDNLINLSAEARHPLLILSDSDMAAPRDYLARVLAALDGPGVGAVTCLYRGRGDAGGWSRLAAMGISQHFLPSVLLGTALGLAAPCMGSTIALRCETLAEIGGFEAFADLLADDHAMGRAVRALGLRVTLPPLVLTHGCTEASLGALARHELRWNRTILSIDPAGFVGSIVLHPLPLALIGGALRGFGAVSIGAAAAAIAARLVVALLIDRATGERTAPVAWIPARDLLSFCLYFGTFFTRSIDWRGAAFTIEPDGRLTTRRDMMR